MHLLLERAFDEAILKECPTVSDKTLYTLKRRMEALVIEGKRLVITSYSLTKSPYLSAKTSLKLEGKNGHNQFNLTKEHRVADRKDAMAIGLPSREIIGVSLDPITKLGGTYGSVKRNLIHNIIIRILFYIADKNDKTVIRI